MEPDKKKPHHPFGGTTPYHIILYFVDTHVNILPGVGNFYLGTGNAAESSHIVYGVLNVLTWPLSIAWGIPEAMIDAEKINQREMLYYYTFDARGKQELQKANVKLTK